MSDFVTFLSEHWRELLVLASEHMVIVLAATGLAVFIGLPLGILLTRIKSLQTPILGVANVLQTVPSLALFGLLIPIPFIGGIGARTAVIALGVVRPAARNQEHGDGHSRYRSKDTRGRDRHGHDRRADPSRG
jgi:osmoprotectant transport system permease protein